MPNRSACADAQRPADVARPDRGGETVRTSFAQAIACVLVGEALHGDDRPEDLTLDHLVVLARGRRRPSARDEEARGRSGAPPPVTTSPRRRALEEALDALALARRVQRPERRVLAASVSPTTSDCACSDEPEHDVVVDLRPGEHPRRGRAVLARVVVAGALRSSRAPRSRSTSSKTITGALPPSSRWTRLSVLGGGRARSACRCRPSRSARPCRRRGARRARCADRLAVAADHVEHARRQDLRGELGEAQRRDRRRARPASARSCCRPRAPGRSSRPPSSAGSSRARSRRRRRPARGGSSRCSRACTRRRTCPRAARRAGEEAQVVDAHRDLVARVGERLADVDRLLARELLAVLLDRAARSEQRLGALRGSRLRPLANARRGGLDGSVDVVRAPTAARARSPRRSPGSAPARVAPPTAAAERPVDEVLERSHRAPSFTPPAPAQPAPAPARSTARPPQWVGDAADDVDARAQPRVSRDRPGDTLRRQVQ